MDTRVKAVAQQKGAFRRRIAWVFGLQMLAVSIVCIMGIYNVAPMAAVILVVVTTTVVAWLAMRREWRPVRALARLVNRWDGQSSDGPDARRLEQLSTHADPDIASLAHGVRGFARRIVGYNQRERNFTRDASHELRSPLTVIKMSVDMLGDEDGISEFGMRSVQRIKRASLEMEALVETLLILARETNESLDNEHFVVNDVLRQQIIATRELLIGRPIQLQLDEPVQFALQGSSRALSVLCWQLVRNACQQMEQGRIVLTVLPGVISVSNQSQSTSQDELDRPQANSASRHGFELAIAKRISERFGWPLELLTRPDGENVARIHFPSTLDVSQGPSETDVNRRSQ